MFVFKEKNILGEIIFNYFKKLGEAIGIDWNNTPIKIKSFIKGFEVELEHGKKNPSTNITNDNPIKTAKIALAHLHEDPLYYEKLEKYVEK